MSKLRKGRWYPIICQSCGLTIAQCVKVDGRLYIDHKCEAA